MSGRKARRWWVGGLLVAALGFGFFRYRASQTQSDLTFETSKADRGRIVAQVTATGTLSALVTVQVGSQVSGRISQLFADFNSPVKKGQIVAKIDPELFQAALAQARANYVAAQGNLGKAKAQAQDATRQYQRAKLLSADHLIAQSDLDTAQANFESADAAVKASEGGVEQAKASLDTAEVNLAYTTITSPTDGIVISRSVDVGQTVAASLQAPTLFVIAQDLRKMQVDTSVAEADIGKLEAGKPATFTVDAYGAEKFQGRIRQIRNAPQTVQNVVTYDAVIDVDNPDLRLRPGMTANCTFIYAQKDDTLRVTNAALRFRPTPEILALLKEPSGKAPSGQPPGTLADTKKGRDRADRRTVWVLRQGVPTPVAVRTGVSDGTITEILEGDVREGEELITDASGPPSAATPAPPMRRLF
jgi:HlyD family secretion protein